MQVIQIAKLRKKSRTEWKKKDLGDLNISNVCLTEKNGWIKAYLPLIGVASKTKTQTRLVKVPHSTEKQLAILKLQNGEIQSDINGVD